MASNEKSMTSRHRATLSCLECHKRKKKCDRKLPCDQCSKTKHRRRCQYQELQDPEYSPPGENLVSVNAPRTSVAEYLNHNEKDEPLLAAKIGLQRLLQQPGNEVNPDPLVETEPGLPDIENMMEVMGLGPSGDEGTSTISSMTPRDGLLMNNFLTLFKHRLDTFSEFQVARTPTIASDDWLTRAMSHPATFYSILYCGATMYADTVRRRYKEICPKSGCLPYKISAIRNINEYLTSSTTAVTDEMILAVLIIMNFDSAMETLEEYQVHMLGLHRMIELRGGMEALGYHGILKNWYQWCNSRLRSENFQGTKYFKAIDILPGHVSV